MNSSNCTCGSESNELVSTIIGYLAGSIIAISFIVQIIWMLKIKSFKDVSHAFLALQMLVGILYLIYGVLEDLQPLYIMESLITILIILAIVLKVIFDRKYGRKENKENTENIEEGTTEEHVPPIATPMTGVLVE